MGAKMLFTIEELLTIAKEKKASDVHMTVGLPPRIRINGEILDRLLISHIQLRVKRDL